MQYNIDKAIDCSILQKKYKVCFDNDTGFIIIIIIIIIFMNTTKIVPYRNEMDIMLGLSLIHI